MYFFSEVYSYIQSFLVSFFLGKGRGVDRPWWEGGLGTQNIYKGGFCKWYIFFLLSLVFFLFFLFSLSSVLYLFNWTFSFFLLFFGVVKWGRLVIFLHRAGDKDWSRDFPSWGFSGLVLSLETIFSRKKNLSLFFFYTLFFPRQHPVSGHRILKMMARQNAQACPVDGGEDDRQMPAFAEWCAGTAYASETYLGVEHLCAASPDQRAKNVVVPGSMVSPACRQSSLISDSTTGWTLPVGRPLMGGGGGRESHFEAGGWRVPDLILILFSSHFCVKGGGGIAIFFTAHLTLLFPPCVSVRSSKGGGGGFTNSPNVLSPCGSHLWAFFVFMCKPAAAGARKNRRGK